MPETPAKKLTFAINADRGVASPTWPPRAIEIAVHAHQAAFFEAGIQTLIWKQTSSKHGGAIAYDVGVKPGKQALNPEAKGQRAELFAQVAQTLGELAVPAAPVRQEEPPFASGIHIIVPDSMLV